MGRKELTALLHPILWLLVSSATHGAETDIQCLQSIRASLRDPNNNLRAWKFGDGPNGYICRFPGVECWHPDENKVLALRLSRMDLQGRFPSGLENCTSLNILDLSRNNLSGPIPPDIHQKIKFVTTLDLSYNGFSGEIPLGLANCSYLNALNLQHNQLSGGVPPALGQLARLTSLNVADNLLTGAVPPFVNADITLNIENNPGLCWGSSSGSCRGKEKINVGIVVGPAAGGMALTAIVVVVILFFRVRRAKPGERRTDDGNRWAKSFTGTKDIKARRFFFCPIT